MTSFGYGATEMPTDCKFELSKTYRIKGKADCVQAHVVAFHARSRKIVGFITDDTDIISPAAWDLNGKEQRFSPGSGRDLVPPKREPLTIWANYYPHRTVQGGAYLTEEEARVACCAGGETLKFVEVLED